METLEKKEKIDAPIELPEIRGCLLAAIKNLSNIERQKIEWCSDTAMHRFWDTMRFAIADFESIPLEDWPEEQIGNTIRNKEELALVLDVMNKLWKVIKVIGIEKPDEDYLNSPLWYDVVEAAAKAYNFIKEQSLDDLNISWLEEAHTKKL